MQALSREFEASGSSETILPSQAIRLVATTAERGMGGTSGALYAIFLNAVSNSLRKSASVPSTVYSALNDGLGKLYRYTLARKGHRTVMDALIPFVETLQQTGSLAAGYAVAQPGAESTRQMLAAVGRASYVGQDVFDQHGGIPDPGALGVVSVIRGIVGALGLVEEDKA